MKHRQLVSVVDATAEAMSQFGLCGYKNPKKPGFEEKSRWLKKRFSEGMKLKTLYSEKNGAVGSIEYVPGEYAWRGISAYGYMVIHCIFLGFKKEYKGKGYGKQLLDTCIEDAKKSNMNGVAVVTRKGAFMAGKGFFIKQGFEIVDSAPSDFDLLALKFKPNVQSPTFRKDWALRRKQYGKGLVIIRAEQCPYTVKNVNEIVDVAKSEFNIDVKVITLKNAKEAQANPCPFGTFCILYDEEIIAEHPISSTRFRNIINKMSL